MVWLAFEGVWQRTTVFLNGQPLDVDRTSSFEPCTVDNPGTPPTCANGTAGFHSGHWEGYTGFTLRIDNQSSVSFGGKENVLAVHVSAEKGTGWWYEVSVKAYLLLASCIHLHWRVIWSRVAGFTARSI